MKKNVLLLLTFLVYMFSCLPLTAEILSKDEMTERDGFKWIYIRYTDGKIAFQNVDGSYIMPPTNINKSLPKNQTFTFQYSKGYATDNRPPFITISIYEKKKNGDFGKCLKNAVFSRDGKCIIPFDREYTQIIYSGGNIAGNIEPPYFSFKKKGKDNYIYHGVCDILGNEIIEAKYGGICYLFDGFQVETGINKYEKTGIRLNKEGLVDSDAIVRTKGHTSDNEFQYFLIYQNNYYGVEDINGNTLIPLSRKYDKILLMDLYGINSTYFLVEKDGKVGACDLNGNEIVPVIYSDVSYYTKGFYVSKDKNSSSIYLNIFLPNHNKIIFERSNSNTQISTSQKETSPTDFVNSYLVDKLKQAENTNIETKTRIKLYEDVINEDKNNAMGLQIIAYNNLGVLYSQIDKLGKAENCFKKALKIDKNYELAKENLEGVKLNKKAKRQERWNKFSNVMGKIGQGITGGMAGTSNGGYYGGNTNSYVGNNIGTVAPNYGTQTVTNADGSTTTVNTQPCQFCGGRGICTICGGLGGTWGRAYGGIFYPCKSCAGSKACQYCRGQGYVTTTTMVDASGHGTIIGSNGYSASGNAGGAAVFSPTTGYHGYPGKDVGGSSSSSTSSSNLNSQSSGSCSYCGGTGVDRSPGLGSYNLNSSWLAYTNSNGDKCPYCNHVDFHYHTKCSHCNTPSH